MTDSILKPGKRLKAVIFDLDDTLVESTVNYGKFKQLVIDKLVSWGQDRGSYKPDETIVAIISRYERRMKDAGISNAELESRLAELDEIMDKVELEKVTGTREIKGARRLLQLLKSRHVKVGILTRGCGDYAHSALAVTNMLDLVDAIECRNSNAKPKPNPESYLRLAKTLGVRPDETVFVGDHPIDAQCAANAGVAFLAVRTGDVPDAALLASGSVKIFSDVGEMVDWFTGMLGD